MRIRPGRTPASVLLAVLLALLRCAGTLPDGTPERFILKRVPFIRQGTMECGPACMAMVMNYHGKNFTLRETAVGLEWTREHGVPTWKMRKYPAKEGMKGTVFSWWRASPERIVACIRAGNPVIVRQWYNRKYRERGYSGHYRVVTGYDLKKKRFYLHDPLGKRRDLRWLPFDEFEYLWDMTDHPWPSVNWMLVVEKNDIGISNSLDLP